jgi:hypothetical protein
MGREKMSEIQRSELMASESRTLSSLAALERSLNDFIKSKRHIPVKLDELVPEYLGKIPVLELGIPGHKDTDRVQYYPASIIVNGQVNGRRLKDTGFWGYAFNDRQVIVFVDCTHKSMRGAPWYQARGVF